MNLHSKDTVNKIGKVSLFRTRFINPITTSEYELPISSEVISTVYNLKGSEVRRYSQGFLSAGNYSIQWDGRNESGNLVASGTYFYRVEVKTKGITFVDIKKMSFMK